MPRFVITKWANWSLSITYYLHTHALAHVWLSCVSGASVLVYNIYINIYNIRLYTYISTLLFSGAIYHTKCFINIIQTGEVKRKLIINKNINRNVLNKNISYFFPMYKKKSFGNRCPTLFNNVVISIVYNNI